jgi:small subunit ribosomal protein S11
MQVHILATFNNTLLSFTNSDGQIQACQSAGSAGFKGARRATSYAAQTAGELLAKKIRECGTQSINVRLKGFGPGREASIKGLKMGGVQILTIEDLTPIPHNGCRSPKKRRF